MNVLDDIVSIGCCSYPCLGQTTLLLEIRSPNQTKAINLLSILIISLISIFKFNEIIEKTQKQVIGCPKFKKKIAWLLIAAWALWSIIQMDPFWCLKIRCKITKTVKFQTGKRDEMHSTWKYDPQKISVTFSGQTHLLLKDHKNVN